MTLRHLNFLLSFALVLAMTTSTQAQQLISVDFGDSTDRGFSPSPLYSGLAAAPDVAGGGTWNRVFSRTASGLVDSTNTASSVGINSGNVFFFSSLSSPYDINPDPTDQEVSGGFSDLFGDYLFSASDSGSLVTANIFGLIPGNAYDLYFYGQGDNFTSLGVFGGQNVGVRIGTDVRHTSHDGVLGGDGLIVEDIEYVVFRGIVADSIGQIDFEHFNPGQGLHGTDSTFFDSSLLAAGNPLAADPDENNSRFHALNGIQIVGEFPPLLLGDTDLDTEVTFADIPSFIAILQAGTLLAQADCNQDGVVDFADIPAFIAILLAS